MITIDIDILNNPKVLKTILGEIGEENSWRICFNATPENEHWKDYPNKCARYFSFDMERRVFSWKCHDNLALSDTTHLATPGHALEFLENIFSIQDRIIDKNKYINNHLSETSEPDITASVSAPDPKPSYPAWDMDILTYKPSYNWESNNPYKYDVYGNPMPYSADDQYYSKIKNQIFSCESMQDLQYIYTKLAGKHDHVSEKLMDLLMKMKQKLEHQEYMTNMYGEPFTKSHSLPLMDYQTQMINYFPSPEVLEKHMEHLKEISKNMGCPILISSQKKSTASEVKHMDEIYNDKVDAVILQTKIGNVIKETDSKTKFYPPKLKVHF